MEAIGVLKIVMWGARDHTVMRVMAVTMAVQVHVAWVARTSWTSAAASRST